MDDFRTHLLAFFLKAWLYICYVGIGLIGVFAEKLRTGKTMTIWQIISTAAIALFVGYLASVWCFKHDMESQSAYIVPIATLLSDKIFVGLMSIEWKTIWNAVIDKLRENKSEDK